jgi:GTPase KRas protein
VICCCCEPAKKQISVDGLTALLYLDDFDLSIHYHEYLKKIDGFVLIYDITSRSSVEELLNIKELIDCYKNENAPLVLVGNKIDLESQRQISTEEGQKLAAK